MVQLKAGLAVPSACFSPLYAAEGHQKAPPHFPIFFSFTALWGVVVDCFGAHDKPGTLPASVRKYSIYGCVGYL